MANDDDKTVMEPPRKPPAPADEDHDNALPVGTRLGEFEITGLVGVGGFGIVYLAYDHSLHRTVALKEYMPSALAARTQGITVSVKSARHEETFNAGMRSFVNEARLLAQFDHPSLVKVYRFWEGNGTAYMVMPFYEGPTLKQALKKMAQPPGEDWLKNLLAQLVEALDIIHREQCFHRDIAPDNILLLKDGRPLLLDFGAARRVIGDMTQALTVILKPGYAPVEQYAEVPHMKQGAWTDVYALAAVVYFAIIGKAPTPSVGRLMNDTLVPLTESAAGRYSDTFLRGIDRALAVKPEDRPQSMSDLRDLLGLHVLQRPVSLTPHGDTPKGATKPSTKRALPLPALAAVAVLVLAVVGTGTYFYLQRGPETIEPPPAVTEKLEPQAPEGTPTAQTADGKTVSEQQLAQMLGARTEEPPPEQTPASPPKPVDPVEMLDQVFQGRDHDHAMSVQLEQSRVRVGKDKLRFRVTSAKSGYLYILMVGTERKHLNLLFPNAIDKKNQVKAYTPVSLPRRGWTMVAGGPAGTDNFVAIVSDNPRDFSAAGMKKVDPFAEFPLDEAARLAQSYMGEGSPLAGVPVCPKGAGTCSAAYGATTFSIEEVEGARG
jgi:serine/threonine protein kinase